jgi:prolyl oligopeptidase
MTKPLLCVVGCAVCLAAGFANGFEESTAMTDGTDTPALSYPETRRVEHVDDYHGTQVPDPYRWLEADVRESEEVAEWVAAQNKVARAYLDAIPVREKIETRLRELWNYERLSAPFVEGGRYFYTKNDGLQNQSVLYVAEAYDATGRVLVDPNKWSEDGTISMRATSVSEDGRLLAYARAEAGSDWQQIYLLNIETGEHLPDRIEWVRNSGATWNKDGTGFYYSRYPEPAPGEKYQAAALNRMIYFHKLGTKQSEDVLIYRRPDHPDWTFGAGPTDDGKYLVLELRRSTDPQNQVYVRPADAAADAPWTELIGDFENEFSFIGNDGTKFYFLTDLAAPTKRIVAMDINRPGRGHLTEIVPAGKGTLDSASILSGKLILQYMEDVRPHVRVFDLAGNSLGEVALPGFGSVGGFGGDQDDTETFYTFTSYNTPPSVYRYDVKTGESKFVRRPKVPFDPDQYAVEQVFYKSKDGTRIPMTLAYRQNLDRSRPQPTLLYGYGGYNISLTPGFSTDYVAWMELGGVLAVANLRGGGEYGEDWHQAGKTLKKQNVFDDFIAAAEYLIAEGRTSREKLAIMGGSNGGLLVGAVMTQRPELFGACIPMVGVMDMLRFHKFTAGQFWRDEYGSADDPEDFKALIAYSPYHNAKAGTKYPPTLITTADTDDRVVPMHSFKFGAAMQRAQGGDAPILLRIESRAGHGSGTPISKQIEFTADRWAFLAKTLGMEPAAAN